MISFLDVAFWLVLDLVDRLAADCIEVQRAADTLLLLVADLEVDNN